MKYIRHCPLVICEGVNKKVPWTMGYFVEPSMKLPWTSFQTNIIMNLVFLVCSTLI